MENLFKKVEDKGHVAKLEALKKNIAFANRLVQDLQQAFEVQVEHKRRDETTMRVVAYAPSQFGRYGYGFTFEATSEGVTFQDGRGVWLCSMAKILKAKVNDSNDYQDGKKANDLALAKAAKKLGIEVTRSVDTSCGDHFTIKTDLSEDDKRLEMKLKVIVATMQAQSVVSRL